MHLFYATRDGQARLIADRISERLGEQGISAAPRDLSHSPASAELPDAARLAVVVAAVRYGRHLPEAERFVAANRAVLSAIPLVFVSVNLTARKPGKDTESGNPYLRKFIARHRLTPVVAMAVAGRLDYPRYGWFDRQMIRFIMALTGGPTDPGARVEFTAWPAVDALASQIARLYNRGRGDAAPRVRAMGDLTMADRHDAE
jgi:menaquinone-dependent protoporphyrinogen oxidase